MHSTAAPPARLEPAFWLLLLLTHRKFYTYREGADGKPGELNPPSEGPKKLPKSRACNSCTEALNLNFSGRIGKRREGMEQQGQKAFKEMPYPPPGGAPGRPVADPWPTIGWG